MNLKKLLQLSLLPPVLAALPGAAQADYYATIQSANANPLAFSPTGEDLPFRTALYVTQAPDPANRYHTCAARIKVDGAKVEQLVLLGEGVAADPGRPDVRQVSWGWVSVPKAVRGAAPAGGVLIGLGAGAHVVAIEAEHNLTGIPGVWNGHLNGQTLLGCDGSAAVTIVVNGMPSDPGPGDPAPPM